MIYVSIGWQDRIILHLRYPHFIDVDEPTARDWPDHF